jgi:hypothetical protein
LMVPRPLVSWSRHWKVWLTTGMWGGHRGHAAVEGRPEHVENVAEHGHGHPGRRHCRWAAGVDQPTAPTRAPGLRQPLRHRETHLLRRSVGVSLPRDTPPHTCHRTHCTPHTLLLCS